MLDDDPTWTIPAIDGRWRNDGSRTPCFIPIEHRMELSPRRAIKPYEGPDLSNDFHIIALEWETDHICWFLDGKLVFESSKGSPDEPMYIIINTAVGGVMPSANEICPTVCWQI